MKMFVLATVLLFLALPTQAMKNRQVNVRESCDDVWLAAVAVAKTQDYRIISIASDERIISVAAGGIWWGERMMSVSLSPGAEHGCTISVQSRYSGLQHSDAPDLLARIRVRLLSKGLDPDSPALQKFHSCMNSYNPSVEKCEEKLRKALVAHSDQPPQEPQPNNLPAPATDGWWNHQPAKPANQTAEQTEPH